MIRFLLTWVLIGFNWQVAESRVIYGEFIAWDTSSSIRLNAHDPEQHFIVKSRLGNDGARSELIKLVYNVPTNSLRGGAHFIDLTRLDDRRARRLIVRQPVGERETYSCQSFSNFVLDDDDSVYHDDEKNPILLFRSMDVDALMYFEKLDSMPCLILKVVPW